MCVRNNLIRKTSFVPSSTDFANVHQIEATLRGDVN